MSRAAITIRSDDDRRRCATWARNVPPGTRVEWKAPQRSLDQNAIMWARLGEIAKAADWHGEKLTADEWKIVFTAGLRKTRVVPNLTGDGFVQLGASTSDMGKAEMTALLDLIDHFAATRGIELKA